MAEIKFVHMTGQSASNFHPSSPLATLDLHTQVHSIDITRPCLHSVFHSNSRHNNIFVLRGSSKSHLFLLRAVLYYNGL